jgi:hypothetical protein
MSNIPALVQPADYFCVFVGTEISRLIALGEWLNGDKFAQTLGKEFSHAGMAVAVTKGLDGPLVDIVEAWPSGVRRLPWHYDGLANVTLWSTGVLEPKDRAATVNKANAMVGEPYGWLNYPAIGLRRLHVPAPLLDWYVSRGKSVICSQVVDLSWRAGGTVLRPDLAPGYVTPQEEADLLMDAGAVPLSGQ